MIHGLTDSPIVLKGSYSQTYLPGHHNFVEFFVFDPKLEEDIPDHVVSALAQLNVEDSTVTLCETNAA